MSDTFSEAFDEDQTEAILKRIRAQIVDVLPEFNPCLESIEIEPIAKVPEANSTD